MSKPPAGVVSGGSPFDVKLLALTARLSQWANQERTAGEVGVSFLVASHKPAWQQPCMLGKGREACFMVSLGQLSQ
jgi:hypothetical protein